MTILLAAMQNSLLVLESSNYGWKIQEHLKGCNPNAVSFDLQQEQHNSNSNNNSTAYCGTWNNGLWRTNDDGQTWNRIGNKSSSSSSSPLPSNIHRMSISVSSIESGEKGDGKLYVGTEPSTLYVSDDVGDQWEKINRFIHNLKSSSFWSFPPRPWTHHIRWIEPDKNRKGYLFVAIEAGALIQSHDGGKTWIDRVDGGPYDTHILLTHTKSPKRLYSAAGDGYFESFDYGDAWQIPIQGL